MTAVPHVGTSDGWMPMTDWPYWESQLCSRKTRNDVSFLIPDSVTFPICSWALSGEPGGCFGVNVYPRGVACGNLLKS